MEEEKAQVMSKPKTNVSTVLVSHVEEQQSSTTTASTAITDLPDLRGQSLYQRKCTVLGRAIDAYGMGRYQWSVWVLCGCGNFIDSLWGQAFPLVLSPLQQELGFSNGQSGRIATSFNAGLTAGTIFWGFMADIVGRRWVFNITCLVSAVFGLCLGATTSYTSFLVLTAFVGFGVGGNLPVDAAIFLEFVPRDRRFLLVCLSIFQPLGFIVSSAVASAFIPTFSCSPNFSEPNPLPACGDVAAGVRCCARDGNRGWRYVIFTTGALSLVVFVLRFLVFSFKETPQYLVHAGRDDEALATMRHITGGKDSKCDVTAEVFETIEREYEVEVGSYGQQSSGSSTSSEEPGKRRRGRGGVAILAKILAPYKVFFGSWGMARLTVLVWLTYIFDFIGFTIASFYLPRIVALKNGEDRGSLRTTYAAFIYTAAPGILGVLAGGIMYRLPAFGRRWTMVLSSGLTGASIFLLATADSVAKREGLFTLQYFFQSMFDAVLYGWTPEAFPAPVRGAANGAAGFWGGLFGLLSPLVAEILYGRAQGGGDVNSVLYLAGGITLGCLLTTALLPTKLMVSGDETES